MMGQLNHLTHIENSLKIDIFIKETHACVENVQHIQDDKKVQMLI